MKNKKTLLVILAALLVSFTPIGYHWLTQIKISGGTGYSLATFNGEATDTVKASANGYYLQSVASAPGFEFKPLVFDTTSSTGLGTQYDLSLKVNISDTSSMLTNYVSAVAGASYLSKSGHTITAATMDTTYITNFYLKVRGLMSASAPVSYSGTTGVISVDTTSSTGLATYYDIRKSDWHVGTYQSLSPSDGATYYCSGSGFVMNTAETGRRFYPARACTITGAHIMLGATSTAGSNENISMYIRVNNTTDYLIATIGNTNADRIFSNLSMTVPALATTDFWIIKIVCPTWATNPTSWGVCGEVEYIVN